MISVRTDQILEARYVDSSRMFLKFADGVEGTWTFSELNLDMSNMKLKTIKASSSGAFVGVTSKLGDDVQLDSSSLRVSIDPDYAAEIENRLNMLANKIGL